MKNLRFYEYDSAFTAEEIAAGGDGNSVKTKIPGVASIWETNGAYFNPHGETKLTHTVTVNYKTSTGKVLAPSDTIEVPYYDGVAQKMILTSKNIENYVPKDIEKTVVLLGEPLVDVDFLYVSKWFFEPLTFNILSSGTIYWKKHTNIDYAKRTIEYKLNDGKWTEITSKEGALAPSISVNSGDRLQFRGDNACYNTGSDYNCFTTLSAKFNIEGNIMSLIDSTGFTTATTFTAAYTFERLFEACDGLVSAENLVLPATGLTEYCYASMFSGCTSLTTAPELPATTLVRLCYTGMFRGCTKLNYIKCLATDISAYQCTSLWALDVSSSGTFVKSRTMNDWYTGASGIPTNWSIEDV